MKKNLLLINTWIYDFAAYDLWIKPLGLLYLAAVLKKNQYKLTYIDCLDTFDPLMQNYLKKNKISLKRKTNGSGSFYKTIVDKPPSLKMVPRNYGRYGITPEVFNYRLRQIPHPIDVILITSMMTYWYPGIAKVIELIKNYDKHIPIILGGNFVTLCPDKALSLGADFTIAGEGENSLLHLLEKITNQPILFNPNLDNLDNLPFPAFDLQRKVNFIPLLTSRGCPFRCSYCASSLLHNRIRRRSVTNIVDEVEYSIKTYGTQHFVFYDDALCYKSKNHLIPLLQTLKEKQFPIFFHTPNAIHAKEITPNLAQLFFQMKFQTLRLGFETSNPFQQKITGGKVTNEQFTRAVKNLHMAGFSSEQIGVYLLVGLPRQQIDEIRESIQFVLSTGATPILAEFSPIPGTPLWPFCVENSPFDLTADPILHNNSIFPCQWENFSWKDYLQLKSEFSKKILIGSSA